MGIHFLNDTWVTKKDLKISAFDLSVLRGYGIFDFLRTYNNKPFRLKEHIVRLFHSASLLEIEVPKTKQEIEELVYDGLKRNSFPETAIKILVTGGESSDSITPGSPSLIIMFTKAPTYPREFYTDGVKIISFPAVRFIPAVKSLNYFAAVVTMRKALKQNAQEALYVDTEGRISECTRSNIFFVHKNMLVAPPEETVLKGITRKVIYEIAETLSIRIVERTVTLNEVSNFQECFITASTIEVLPVVTIDDIKIADGKVGKLTQKIMEKFRKVTKENSASS